MTRSPIRPSSAHRLRTCPASLLMEANCPDEGSKFATRGTAMHELAAECLVNKTNTDAYLGRCVVQGNANLVDEDMADTVQAYLDVVRGESHGGVALIEQQLDFSDLIGIASTYGTADAVVFHTEGEEGPAHVTIIDLKTGFERVYASDNDQLLCYAAGVLNMFGRDGQIESFKLMIVQPTLNHIDSVIISPIEVLAYVAKLREAAKRSITIKKFGASPEDFNPGDKQCRYCKAKATCPALERRVLNAVADTQVDLRKSITEQLQGAIERVQNSDNAHIAECYSVLPLVSAWVSAVETRAYRELEDGHELPGYKLVQGNKGVRRWVDERRVAETLAAISDDIVFEKTLHSPKQIENKVKTGQVPHRFWESLEPLIYQQRTKNQIVTTNDKRQAIKTMAFVAQPRPTPTNQE